ncbi:hypothetical protein [Neobacillus endophyticus]|nr:hypothetical protein [Neobacillus endophyticus]
MEDVCIYCGKELANMERNRAICWDCRDKMTETYDEELESNVKEESYRF